MYSHVACDVIKEQTLYLLKPSSLIWHLMPYLFLFRDGLKNISHQYKKNLPDSMVPGILHLVLPRVAIV